MSEEETVEVTIKVPKKVVQVLREFVLKHDNVDEREYWEREAIGVVMADIDCIVVDEKIDGGDPKPTLKRYGLLKYSRY